MTAHILSTDPRGAVTRITSVCLLHFAPWRLGARLLLLLLCIPLHAVDAADTPVWVDASGDARQGDVETPTEVKQRARRAAETNAIEKATGVFIKSHTLVSNSQLAEDLVFAAVRGKIEQVADVKEDWDAADRERYVVSLRALIRPVYPERGQGLSARLSLSRAELKEGETVEVFYQTGADAFVYLFSVAADGSVTLLLPNSTDRNNAVRGGQAYQFPPAGSDIRLQAKFLPGFKGTVAEERVTLIATRRQEDLIPLGFKEGMFAVFDAKSTGMISDLTKRLNQLEPTDWTQQTATYVLRK